MKFRKQLLSLFGVMALIAASISAGNVAAQSIETTLTVDNSVPACADAVPSSISIASPGLFSDTGVTPTDPPSTTMLRMQGSTSVNFRINTCHEGNPWRVSASIEDFVSTTDSTHTIDSAGTVHLRGSRGVRAQENQDFTGLVGQGTSGPVVVGNWQSNMTVARGYVPFTGDAIVISEGTGTRAGGFTQFIQWGINNVPSDTPPGTYVANMIVTLDVDAAP